MRDDAVPAAWLREDGRGARLQEGAAPSRLAFTGDDDDLDGTSSRGDHGANQHIAGHVRETEIGDDHVEEVSMEGCQRFATTRGARDRGPVGA